MQLAVNEIDELSKTQLPLGLGTKIIQVERELVTIEKNIESLREKMSVIDQRRKEARQCLFKFRTQKS